MPIRTPGVTSPATTRRPADPPLAPGAKGPAVKTLQQLLSTLGKPVGTIDGDFGANTKKAVISFQRDAQLEPTGRVNDRTWTALRAAVAKKQEARFTAPARDVAKRLDGLTRQVDAFTADGRVTSTEKKFMRSLGADDGFALDAGGSAQLFVKGRGMVQRSTDPGGARAVANVIMVQSN